MFLPTFKLQYPSQKDFFFKTPPPPLWKFQLLSLVYFMKFFCLTEHTTPQDIPVPSVVVGGWGYVYLWNCTLRKEAISTLGGCNVGLLFWLNWNLAMFFGVRKTGEPREKNSSYQCENQQQSWSTSTALYLNPSLLRSIAWHPKKRLQRRLIKPRPN